MKLFNHQNVNISTKAKIPLPEKVILWPIELGYGNLSNGDNNCFPTLPAIKARNSNEKTNPLATFGEAISQAQSRVWIIDAHFLEPDKGNVQQRVDQITSWLLHDSFSAIDIRFLIASHHSKEHDEDLQSQFNELSKIINESKDSRDQRCNIEIKFHLRSGFPYVHDRFAIIDDELWHFGATVGGFHSQVSAATRGWSASEHKAEEFFNLAWNS